MSRKNIETRNRILKSTWDLLETGDAKATRMSDIAKASGLSRQAVYLHFPARVDLLIATARYIDDVKDVDARLAASRTAASGIDRLNAYIEAWGNYIPEIFGMAQAFWAMQDTDEAAAAAWNDRMQAVRHGCTAAIKALKADNVLIENLTPKKATDILWTLLSVRNWQHLRHDCGWSQKQYITEIKRLAGLALLKSP